MEKIKSAKVTIHKELDYTEMANEMLADGFTKEEIKDEIFESVCEDIFRYAFNTFDMDEDVEIEIDSLEKV